MEYIIFHWSGISFSSFIWCAICFKLASTLVLSLSLSLSLSPWIINPTKRMRRKKLSFFVALAFRTKDWQIHRKEANEVEKMKWSWEIQQLTDFWFCTAKEKKKISMCTLLLKWPQHCLSFLFFVLVAPLLHFQDLEKKRRKDFNFLPSVFWRNNSGKQEKRGWNRERERSWIFSSSILATEVVRRKRGNEKWLGRNWD